MNKDIRAAMLGDHEAAKRLRDAGVLIPCAHCKWCFGFGSYREYILDFMYWLRNANRGI